jgi:hypothetical protein
MIAEDNEAANVSPTYFFPELDRDFVNRGFRYFLAIPTFLSLGSGPIKS